MTFTTLAARQDPVDQLDAHHRSSGTSGIRALMAPCYQQLVLFGTEAGRSDKTQWSASILHRRGNSTGYAHCAGLRSNASTRHVCSIRTSNVEVILVPLDPRMTTPHGGYYRCVRPVSIRLFVGPRV